jgi:hypothetical protein
VALATVLANNFKGTFLEMAASGKSTYDGKGEGVGNQLAICHLNWGWRNRNRERKLVPTRLKLSMLSRYGSFKDKEFCTYIP